MLARAEHVRQLAAVAIAIWVSSGLAHAVESGRRDAMSESARAPKAVKPATDDDDDDESFFSNGNKESVASAGPTTVVKSAQPNVDVDAVCRAVLADNTNLYNYKFLEGCKRAVALSSARRNAR